MHSVGVFHRDIKPGNILVSKDCQIRITDFGLARFMDERTLVGENLGNPMTEYVVTRWYRSPELLLAPNRPYSAAIDMWSVGCILAEMIRRKPIFPGKSHTHQVQMVLEVRGYSSPADLGFPLSEETKSFLNRRCLFPGQLLSSVIQRSSRDVIELIEALLQLNPDARP
jgi:serine/threonine protein kinase